MRTMKKPLIATALLSTILLAACVPEDSAPPPVDMDPNACGASEYQELVGKNRSTLSALTFDSPVRILEPGGIMTADYSNGRLNISVNERGTITRVYCG
ncbi:I78 family peptidase inhibitor [Xinfangfangia sp. CPCC 101601]|uniref:I78 family peptidase inhibitor n=1 Tax=Pseudogemmobacter lacusdianii TaxID=3069608 RepID=A0ABU0VXM6_9RHOB|nr:I78 family peptidase inhibitor [Xinfangfangia sp. CPCC 101601]MDQ2066516.1 I78 family peptidase inhibitor [Xinfangfangia sp. CPCC 101601]